MKCETCGRTTDFDFSYLMPSRERGVMCRTCFGEVAPFVKVQQPKQEKDAGPKKVDVDPATYPVRKWLKGLIFRDEKISIPRLEGEMADKGYSEGGIRSQMRRIRRDYFEQGGFIYLSKEVAEKLAKEVVTA